MTDWMRQTLAGSTAGLLAASVSAPVVFSLLKRMGSRQTVSEHVPEHASKQGTPTMGGIILLIGMLAGFLTVWDKENTFTLLLVVWYALIGFLDDFVVPRMMRGKRGLGWMPKLAMQTAPFVVLFFLSPTTPLWIFGLMAFVVLLCANAYNFVDGMDGLAGGVGFVLVSTLVAVWSFFLIRDPFASSSASLLPVFGALLFAFVPFLALNAPPAKLFMGDVGSMPIGALLGMGLLNATVFRDPFDPQLERMLPFLPWGLLLLFEIVPVPLQIASAKLRGGKRLFPFKTPVHHGFQSAGWPETKVVAWFVLFQIVCSAGTLAWLVMSEG